MPMPGTKQTMKTIQSYLQLCEASGVFDPPARSKQYVEYGVNQELKSRFGLLVPWWAQHHPFFVRQRLAWGRPDRHPLWVGELEHERSTSWVSGSSGTSSSSSRRRRRRSRRSRSRSSSCCCCCGGGDNQFPPEQLFRWTDLSPNDLEIVVFIQWCSYALNLLHRVRDKYGLSNRLLIDNASPI